MARSWSEPCHWSNCGWWHLMQVSRPTYSALAIASGGTTAYQSQAKTPAAREAQTATTTKSVQRVAKRDMNQSATNGKSGIKATLELCTPIAALSTRANKPSNACHPEGA